MREFLRKKYEKNNKSVNSIYLFLKISFIIFGKYNKFKEETVEALKDFENFKVGSKQYKKQYKKLIVYRYIYYLRASEYYLYDFEKVPYKNRDQFMTRQLTNRYYSAINKKRFRKILDRKNLSYQVFNKYYKRDMICISDENEKNYELFKKFIEGKDKFIIKPFSGHSGEGIEIIKVKDFETVEELFNYTLEKIPYVAEELIKQNDGLGAFHKESVNTIRVVTFQYKKDVSILWAFLRTGQGDSTVDNMGAAGFGALIDHETGKIISDGVDWKGEKSVIHPDSKIKFKGYQIPKWNELLETVKGLAKELSEMHCVGWDLALTDKGWVLVEGNARPQCVTIQTFTKKGYRDYYNKMYILIKKLKEEQTKIMEGEVED